METFRLQRSPARADHLFSVFGAPPPPFSAGGDELQEEDVFWIGLEPSSRDSIPNGSPRLSSVLAVSSPDHNPSLSGAAGSRCISLLSSGILAALSEDHRKPQPFVHQKAAVASSPPLAETSPVSSARMIPAISKLKIDYSCSMPDREIYRQSAPVNVPVVPLQAREVWEELQMDGGDGEREEKEMLPPHEIVARASPMITFSVLEGAGRTLKGRDLRQVRNAVLQMTVSKKRLQCLSSQVTWLVDLGQSGLVDKLTEL